MVWVVGILPVSGCHQALIVNKENIMNEDRIKELEDYLNPVDKTSLRRVASELIHLKREQAYDILDQCKKIAKEYDLEFIDNESPAVPDSEDQWEPSDWDSSDC